MPALVMKVETAIKHPNADTLFVYEMRSSDNAKYQVVANSENIYQVGDSAIVAVSGSKMKDGTYIEESTIRGIVSGGMAVGKTDLPIGTDVTEQYCLPIFHVKWPDIESLFNVRKGMIETDTLRSVRYFSKVKLDGTNAGIQINPGKDEVELVVQSRTAIITPQNDNYGLAAWVENHRSYFTSIKTDRPIIIYGEWFGQGVEASIQIGRKVFCVFAIQYGSELDINPETIRKALPDHPDVFVIPFFGIVVLDYADVPALQSQVDVLNGWVANIEKCDPYVKETFGIESVGEGLVFYPVPFELDPNEPILVQRELYKELVFKAKGEKHKVVKTKAPVQIDPEVAKSIDDFANLFVTENRLVQFANKIGDFNIKRTGEFLKLFVADVLKESEAELDASGMTWAQVESGVSKKAREWWIAKTKELV